MPTRNRAHLLHWSLQSALAQDYEDYEVVVVNNNCEDHTDGVVAQLKTDRVKYFRTARTLSMPDNWEFAWSKASGDYVLYLADDDALVRGALSFLAREVLPQAPRVASWPGCEYFYPDWIQPEKRNRLYIPFDSNSIETYSPHVLAEQVYRFQACNSLPRLLNSCVNRGSFESLRLRLGRLFIPSCPDYSFLALALHAGPELTIVHRPLYVWGASPSSIGAMNLHRSETAEAAQHFAHEFGRFDFFEGCPTRIPVNVNYIAGTLVMVNRVLREAGLDPHPIDWDGYFESLAAAFMVVSHFEPPFHAKYLAELLESARKFSPECERRVNSILRRPRPSVIAPLRRLASRLIQSHQLLCRLELQLRFGNELVRSPRHFQLKKGVGVQSDRVVIDGAALNLHSILDFAGVAEHYFDSFAAGQVGQRLVG